MEFSHWQTVPPNTPLTSLEDGSLLLVRDDRSVVCTIEKKSSGGFSLTWAELPEMGTSFLAHVRSGDDVERAAAACSMSGSEAIRIPAVQWSESNHEPRKAPRGRLFFSMLAALSTIAVLLIARSGVAGALALPLAGLVGYAVWSWLAPPTPTRILTAGRVELDGSNLLGYALARRDGELPEAHSTSTRRMNVLQRCDDVRNEYGRLSSDIAYRIENSALFDTDVPTTAEFQTMLVRLDALGPELAIDELEQLGTELEIAFVVARAHAETIGWTHLPSTARPDARRAAKAATLAGRAATQGEKEAATEQVWRILTELGLAHLPPPKALRRQLTNGTDGSEPGAERE